MRDLTPLGHALEKGAAAAITEQRAGEANERLVHVMAGNRRPEPI